MKRSHPDLMVVVSSTMMIPKGFLMMMTSTAAVFWHTIPDGGEELAVAAAVAVGVGCYTFECC